MVFDDHEFRPITFQGIKFPATLMGVSILEPVLGIKDREFIDWVWGLRVCCGRERNAPAKFCARMAERTVNLMLEHRQKVLDGIRERLGPHGFDANITFLDWIQAFQRIQILSEGAEGDCVWSAPSHPKDMKPADFQRLNSALDRAREQFLKTGKLDIKDGSRDAGNP
ncbi:MAG TPA: hypothetical protein VMJ12_01315 [Candidatus Acidoferrales bacterium]|nr:hypothetical protein [Candidatus Acidoferrales bacterium]